MPVSLPHYLIIADDTWRSSVLMANGGQIEMV